MWGDSMPERGEGVIVFPQYSNVEMHSECRAEIIQLIQKDEIPSFLASYEQRVKFLSEHLGQEIKHKSWFEILKKTQGLRSIRFMKFRNLRILYALESKRAFLLVAFEERQGHRNTEYGPYIDIAQKRLHQKGASR